MGLLAVLGCGGDDAKASKDDDRSGETDEDRSPTGGGAAAVCAQICDRSRAAKCENDPEDCEARCAAYHEESGEACEAEAEAFTTCALGARFTCDEDGESEARSCADELESWRACITGPVTGTRDPDAEGEPETPDEPIGEEPTDASGAGAPLCPTEPSDDACMSCGKEQCCDALASCGVACQRLEACLNDCGKTMDEGCEADCSTQHAAGLDGYYGLLTCFGLRCSSACGGELAGPEVTELSSD